MKAVLASLLPIAFVIVLSVEFGRWMVAFACSHMLGFVWPESKTAHCRFFVDLMLGQFADSNLRVWIEKLILACFVVYCSCWLIGKEQ